MTWNVRKEFLKTLLQNIMNRKIETIQLKQLQEAFTFWLANNGFECCSTIDSSDNVYSHRIEMAGYNDGAYLFAVFSCGPVESNITIGQMEGPAKTLSIDEFSKWISNKKHSFVDMNFQLLPETKEEIKKEFTKIRKNGI